MSSGLRSKSLFKLAQLIAASATFQAIVGAADAAAALAFVQILEATDKDDEHPRPRAIVKFGSDFASQKLGTATWNSGGTVEVCFEFLPADAGETRAENLLAFANEVGLILSECSDLAGQGDAGDGETYLNVVEWTSQNGPPEFSDPQHENGELYLIDDYAARWEG